MLSRRLQLDDVRDLMCIHERTITVEDAIRTLRVRFPNETDHNIQRYVEAIAKVRQIAQRIKSA